MAARERIAMFPSRANMVAMRQRISSAVRGVALLHKKRDALEMQLKMVRKELKEHETEVDNVMRSAILSISRAQYLSTDFRPGVFLQNGHSDVYMRIEETKILGVTSPKLKLIMYPPTALPYTGLASGGRQVDEVRKYFQEALEALVRIASLRFSEMVLQEAVSQTNTRVNGLDYIVIPRFNNTLLYILDELDERDREDFYRMKCIRMKEEKSKQNRVNDGADTQTVSLIESANYLKYWDTAKAKSMQMLISPRISFGSVSMPPKHSSHGSLLTTSLQSLDIDVDAIKAKKVVLSSESAESAESAESVYSESD